MSAQPAAAAKRVSPKRRFRRLPSPRQLVRRASADNITRKKSKSPVHIRRLAPRRRSPRGVFRPPHIPTGPFANAYTILGHGGQEIGEFRVPPNCMVVTAALDSDLIFNDTYNEYLKKILATPMNVLLDPLANPLQIFEKLGPLTYYKPGKFCPNFNYQLVNSKKYSLINDNENVERQTIDYPGSGVKNIMDLQRTYIDNEELIGTEYIDEYDLTLDNLYDTIKSSYDGCVYPESEYIDEALEGLNDYIQTMKSAGHNDTEIISEGINYAITALQESELINDMPQRYLCETYPGIYYNFVCRKNKEATYNMFDHNNFNRVTNRKLITHIPTKYEIDLNQHTAMPFESPHYPIKQQLRNIYEKRIGNTFNRKRQARNYYMSDFYKHKRMAEYDLSMANAVNAANAERINIERQGFLTNYKRGKNATFPTKKRRQSY